jgi:DNA-binding NtrC family response regulator
MKPDMNISILLVEGQTDLRRVISACLEQLNIRVWEAANAQSAKRILIDKTPGALVVDYDFPDLHNGEVIESFRGQESGNAPIIVTTTQRISDEWRERYRPSAVVYKPFDIRLLLRTIISTIKDRRRPKRATST